MNNITSIYKLKPTTILSIYFPYFDFKLVEQYNIDVIIQSSGKDFINIMLDKSNDPLYNALFDINPQYNKLYKLFIAYAINNLNYELKNEYINNKFFIKTLKGDTDYIYILPINYTLQNTDITEINDFNEIKEIKPYKMKLIVRKNFQIFNDKYFDIIKEYFTIKILLNFINNEYLQNKLNDLYKKLNILIPNLFS